MTTASLERSHPMGQAVANATERLLEALEVPLFGVSVGELRTLVRDVTRLASTLAAVEAAVLAQADHSRVGLDSGATSTANWIAHAAKQTRTEAHRRMRLARDLDERPVTAEALAEGRVLPSRRG